jgi:vacuolar iron transporter family protein
MSMAKETRPARRFAGIGRWLVGGTPGSRHRDVQGGTQRAAVLGAGDGLLTNLSLVLGVAGASANASAVRLAGVAGLLAGAFSMAAGELVSVRAQQEMVEREVQVERQEPRR